MSRSEVRARRLEGSDDGVSLPLADLRPVPSTIGHFCQISGGQLQVRIRNDGASTSSPTTKRVEFLSGPGGTELLSTPALFPGASSITGVAFPAGCFAQDCSFRIEATANQDQPESDEGNNDVVGTCIG